MVGDLRKMVRQQPIGEGIKSVRDPIWEEACLGGQAILSCQPLVSAETVNASTKSY